jgi:hypothetical protein
MGTQEQPVAAGVTARLEFTDSGPINREWDPFGISRGLISHGSVSIYGKEVTSHVAVQSAVTAGTTVLQLATVPVGWKAGNSVVIAGTTPGVEQNELRHISSIVGSRVVLDQPLSYDHVPPSPEFQVHVANVTRNAVIDSQSDVVDRRGHVMFMHNRDVDIAYAGFYRLGRTDKLQEINDAVVDSEWHLQPGTGTNVRGRYAVHFHRNGLVNDGNPAVVRGSAVVDSPGWGFTNHSGYVDILDNVAYDVAGAAFATEVGDEIGSFRGNIAIGSTGSGEAANARESLQDFGHQGDGFWFQGAGISVTDNIAAGNQGNAFAFYTRGLIEGGVKKRFLSENLPDPTIANGAETIDVGQVPVREFDNNIGYASARGLLVRYHLEDAIHEQQSVFQDSSFWNNSTGVDLPYAQQSILRNLSVVYAPGVLPQTGVGMNLVTRDIVYENLTVSGYNRGIVVPRRGYAIIRGGQFNNNIDALIMTGASADRYVLLTDIAGQPRVAMSNNFNPPFGSTDFIFRPDVVILDYGPFVNQRLYYKVQHPDAVPFPLPLTNLPPEYVGLTTQELFAQYGVAVGNAIAPLDAFEVPSIVGLIAPAD